jgi:uncharacterized protein (DUF1810 family)
MQADDSRLERFVRAQDRDLAGFQTAIAELASGAKRTHWIWYVFPQITGLGESFMSRQFAIEDANEAAAYLQHDVLGPRLLLATKTVAEQLGRGVRLRKLMGVEIDVLKLVSSLTLFRHVAGRDPGAPASEFTRLADQVLAAAAAEGYPACAHTLRRLGSPVSNR